MILQALLGGAAGLFVAIKMFGVRIKETLFFWRKDEDEAPAADKPRRQPAPPSPPPSPRSRPESEPRGFRAWLLQGPARAGPAGA